MIHLGRHSYNYGVQKGNGNDVHIGAFSSIAEGVIFDSGINHDTSFVSTFPFHKIWSETKSNIKIKGDIKIGSDVWIGMDVIIMSDVTIGDGAVIGARTIVTKDVEPYSIVAGTPMKFIGARVKSNLLGTNSYCSTKANKLISIAWWNWDDAKIKENLHLLQSNNIDEFIKLHYDSNKS